MMGHQHAVAVVVVAAIMHDMRRRVVLGGRIGYRVEVAIVVDTIKKISQLYGACGLVRVSLELE